MRAPLLLALGLALLSGPSPVAATPDGRAATAAPPAGLAPAVRRGDRVQLTARAGAITAEVEAEALQDGRPGEIIRVRNLHNGRVQQGRVARPGHVEVTN